MILGILADTHGRGELTRVAIRLLRQAGAEAFVHCGDVGGPVVFDALAGLWARFVWGNSDDPGPALEACVRRCGLPLPDAVPLRLELAGKSIAVFHGHEPEFRPLAALMEAGDHVGLAAAARAQYVLFGHFHRRFNQRLGSVRMVNPGALHRARPASVATLDLAYDVVHFWDVEVDSGRRRCHEQCRDTPHSFTARGVSDAPRRPAAAPPPQEDSEDS